MATMALSIRAAVSLSSRVIIGRACLAAETGLMTRMHKMVADRVIQLDGYVKNLVVLGQDVRTRFRVVKLRGAAVGEGAVAGQRSGVASSVADDCVAGGCLATHDSVGPE